MTEEPQPEWTVTTKRRFVVFYQHTPNHIFIDIGAKGEIDLVHDARATKSWIALPSKAPTVGSFQQWLELE